MIFLRGFDQSSHHRDNYFFVYKSFQKKKTQKKYCEINKMGQSTSSCKDFIPDTIDNVQFQIKKHGKIFTDINSINYEEFQKNLEEINDLSRKCIDKDGNQLVFAINKGSDQIQWLWKATIKIAAVSINPQSRKINNVKIISLKQFLHIFNTMATNIEAIQDIEERQRSASSSPNDLYPTALLDQIDGSDGKFNFDKDELFDDCIICLDRKPEVILPCLHQYCLACLTQWHQSKQTCPICDQHLISTQETWTQLDFPDADEINEEIVNQLQKITSDK